MSNSLQVPPSYSVEKDLASELLKLSHADRVEIEEEIHGVRCGAAIETPELLERSLAEFDAMFNARKEGNGLLRNVVCISSLNETEVKAAKEHCYLNDPDVRLRFLRCEQFEVEKAVERLCNFLNLACELYGDYVADRPISISDFNPQEVVVFENSRAQYLPFRDRSGRRVFVSVGSCNMDENVYTRVKLALYLHWVASEDVESQRKGLVFVMWIYDESEEKSWQHKIRQKLGPKMKEYHLKHWVSIPLRIVAVHQYYAEDTLFSRSMWALYYFHNRDAAVRKTFRSYYGNPTELLYKLSSYGVPSDLMPVACTGKVKTANHRAFLNAQRAKLHDEEMGNNRDEEIVDCPGSHDVVFKTGPCYRNNPGNLVFRSLVETEADSHRKASRGQKFKISMRIVEAIEESNGRFLEWSKKRKLWLVIKDRSRIRSKVATYIKQYNLQKRQLEQQVQRMAITDTPFIAKDCYCIGEIHGTEKRRKLDFTSWCAGESSESST